jgi:hypothetical protein
MNGVNPHNEIKGSNPTRSILFNLGNYGIKLSLFLINVGQNPPATTFFAPAIGTFAGRRASLTFRRQAATVGASYFHTRTFT